MTSQPPDEDLTPAELAVRRRLATLRAEGPQAAPPDPHALVRTARWQRAARAPLHVAGLIAAAAGDAVRLLVGGRPGPGGSA